MNQFWMVWADDTIVTRYRHPTPQSAENEARRLAIENRGKKYFVLCALSYMELPTQPVEYQILTIPDELPF